jgi:hypothetical protein
MILPADPSFLSRPIVEAERFPLLVLALLDASGGSLENNPLAALVGD